MANHSDYDEDDMTTGADTAGLVTSEILYKHVEADRLLAELNKRYVERLVDVAFPEPTLWERICSFFK